METKGIMRSDVLVVIPTYNESETIGQLLDELLAYRYRAVVVDDSEDERTAESARARGAYIIRRFEKGGLGPAIQDGLHYASLVGAQYGVVMDAGGTHRAQDVWKLETIAQRLKFDLVIGSRFMDRYQWQGWRTLLSRLGTWSVRLLLGIDVTDVTCGFRCYRLNELVLSTRKRTRAKGHAFQFEFLTQLVRRGAKVGEVAIPYRLVGKSTLDWSGILEALRVYVRLFFWRW